MLIACYAYEGMYQGLHGIEDKVVLEVKDIEEAREALDEWGMEASEGLIYSYGLEDEYFDECEADGCEYDITDSISWCERGWYGHIIKDGKFASAAEADAELSHHDFNTFVEMYCELSAID